MKHFVSGAVSAGLMLAASAAHAQMLAPSVAGNPSYRAVSDFDGPYEPPYAVVVPPAPPRVYDYGAYGAGPALLPPHEVYAVLRDNGFSPLGIPHQRGLVYTIAAVDRHGEDGRVVIDARDGRIIRFVPSYGYGPYGGRFEAAPMSGYGPESALPPPTVIRGAPRPPAPVSHVASREVPLPTPKPRVVAAKPPAPQQSAAVETRPAAARPTASAAAQTSAAPAPPATPATRPTQEMPVVQGLE